MAKLIQFLTVTVLLALTQLHLTNAENLCVCPRILDPVCGSDGVTYGNPCEFACAQKLRSDLTIRSKGRCDSKPQTVDEETLCFCTREMRPVCGSDSRTYSNLCELKCAQRTRTELTLSHNGPCPGDKSNLIV